ncbi:N-acetyltransferase family protein [Marinilongibacter aquaticus]|uniref:GNAT family N-acetyltransferase n=1 Tax=Marinilongibacter aquaticus TaxID=2975157 RepID=UPI0021BD6BF3|nr:GNAT family N-acetyltransferase [Marinilongibacter aquaticus]UBM57805.1 N-acetyltransferase family protein [Marinilongibacter aquaticus]
MNIEFRDLREEDLGLVKGIYDWYVLHSTATFHTEPVEVEELKSFIYIGHARFKSFLIYHEQQLAGYCYFSNYKKRQAYDRTAEVTIYLNPGFEKKGIGRASLAKMEEVAKEKGFKNLLGIITGDNHGSIALFQKSGYFKCAEFKQVGEKFGKVLDVLGFQKEI